MKSVVITGCNRGIGLALIKHLSNKSQLNHIIATCRNPENAQELQEVNAQHKNVRILKAELTDNESIKKLAGSISDIVKDDGLNVLINNAGISSKFASINLVKPNELIENFQINTVAPIMLTKALLPVLKKSAKQNANKPMGISKAAIINMSSILGSMAENVHGGLYPYRASKAGLNAATKSMSIDLKTSQIVVVSLHPGWVKTDLGGPNAPLDVDTSVAGVIDFLYNITEEHNGGFYDYQGKRLSW